MSATIRGKARVGISEADQFVLRQVRDPSYRSAQRTYSDTRALAAESLAQAYGISSGTVLMTLRGLEEALGTFNNLVGDRANVANLVAESTTAINSLIDVAAASSKALERSAGALEVANRQQVAFAAAFEKNAEVMKTAMKQLGMDTDDDDDDEQQQRCGRREYFQRGKKLDRRGGVVPGIRAVRGAGHRRARVLLRGEPAAVEGPVHAAQRRAGVAHGRVPRRLWLRHLQARPPPPKLRTPALPGKHA